MGYTYNAQELIAFFNNIIEQQLDERGRNWLQQKAPAFLQGDLKKIKTGFSAIARFAGRNEVSLSKKEQAELKGIRDGFVLTGRPMEQLLRCWYLLQFPADNKAQYIHNIESLFEGVEMKELAALYVAFPLLAYPETFRERASEGVRTNIGSVFEAIALDNPYPMEYLEENAWNQLVLKAFFMEKPVERIIGLDERANPALAKILHDYAHERWSAHRRVNPQLWRPASRFTDGAIIRDIERLFAGDELEQKTAALACATSSNAAATQLLEKYPALRERVEKGELTWEKL